MKRNQIYTGIIVFVCCVLVAIGVTLRLLKHADKLPVKVPVLVNRQKPQVADTLKKKPVAKPDFRISGTLKDTEGRGVAGARADRKKERCGGREGDRESQEGGAQSSRGRGGREPPTGRRTGHP